MSQIVTMFTSEDAGAPQLTDQKPSEIIDILTKCLIDGYGAKQPLGWTRPFYDAATQSVVFRNNTANGGSGGYVKIYSNDASDNMAAIMRITHAASMSDINSFFNQGFTQAFRAQRDTFNPSQNRNRWVLVGTSLAFYFFINMNVSTLGGGANEQPAFFVGDFYSAIAEDAGRFVTLVNPSQQDTVNTSSSALNIIASGQLGIGTTNMRIYDADGHPTPNNYAVWRSAPPVEFTAQAGFNIEITSEHVLMPVGVVRTNFDIDTSTTDRLGTLLHVSTVSPSMRGVFPGLGLSLKPGYQGFTWPVIRSIGGKNHLLFRNHQSGPCNMWLNTEVWDDPFGNV